jgi:putative serine protease PepD
MGVQLRDGTNGPFIVAVTAGGPAAKAGVAVGDIVLSVDGTPTPDSQTLIELVAGHRPGDVIKLQVQHQSGTSATVSLTLGQLPS